MVASSESTVNARWSSRIGFLWAAIGAAVGLGSVWKFPYVVGTGGGGAFVLVYLAASAFVTLPILIAELTVGRAGQANPPEAIARVCAEAQASPAWRHLGWVMILTIYLILTYYSVIGGWVLAYIFKAAGGQFWGASPGRVSESFNALRNNFGLVMLWHAVFMGLTVLLVARGVRKGIEAANRIMMPGLFLILVILIAYAAYAGNFAAGFRFLFYPDFSKLTGEVVLTAVGLSFFSIGTGMAIMMTYGSYLAPDASLPRSAIMIAASVPVAALSAGLATFPLVFGNGLDPASGPGLLFVTLPLAFGQMPGGTLFGTLFFIFVTFAALTSSIAILEPLVAWAEQRGIASRVKASLVLGGVAWALGLVSAWSLGVGAAFHPLQGLGKYGGMSAFDLLDFVTSNVMLPITNILICVFVGWILPRAWLARHGDAGNGLALNLWRIALRVVAPVAISLVLWLGL
jgi:NSS family neurotransmitter:Na+ symporter